MEPRPSFAVSQAAAQLEKVSEGACWPELGFPDQHPGLLGGRRHLSDILDKAGHNNTQAALEPLISGIGGRFADRTGITKLDHLWDLVRVPAPFYLLRRLGLQCRMHSVWWF